MLGWALQQIDFSGNPAHILLVEVRGEVPVLNSEHIFLTGPSRYEPLNIFFQMVQTPDFSR